MKSFTTGQIAKRANVNVETIRYYERRGIIPDPPRRKSGYRQYPENAVARIQFVKRAQALGFTLEEILELLNLSVDPQIPCADVKQQADLKIANIEEKLESLNSIKEVLNKFVASCSDRSPVGDCPILEALSGDGSW